MITQVRAPVFPLANVVFFPHTFLPLHVFEPRYVAMVSAALAGDGLVTMVLAREERPAGEQPAVYPVGSIGRVVVADELDNGRYNIVLDGLARLRPRPASILLPGWRSWARPCPTYRIPEWPRKRRVW